MVYVVIMSVLVAIKTNVRKMSGEQFLIVTMVILPLPDDKSYSRIKSIAIIPDLRAEVLLMV
jgi:hypothetical protein